VVERTVKSRGKAGQVHLPKDWTGKRARILLSDPLDIEEKELPVDQALNFSLFSALDRPQMKDRPIQ
jgi:hypothetical protein